MTKKILIDEAVVKQAIWTLERLGEASDTDVSPKKWYEARGWPTLEALEAVIADQKAAQANNEVVNGLTEQSDYNICPACGGIASDPIVPVEARQQAAEPQPSRHRLLEALARLKIRIAFIGWPAESMRNVGTDSQPRWVPDWRYESQLIEHLLNGAEITAPENPADTKPANEIHPAPTQQPVLVRDLAEILGATVPEVCDALAECGGPRRSTNMAVSGLEAVAVAAQLKQAAEPVVGWVLLREDADGFEPIMFYGGKEKPEGEFKDRFTLRPIRFADATQQDGTNGVVALQEQLQQKPVALQPLTDEQILSVARDHYNPHQRAEISFARAIEQAHNITGSKEGGAA